MRSSPAAALVCLSFLSWPAHAQVATGDIAVTGFSSTSFGVIGAGAVVTGYTTPGFQGTGTATSQSVLWNPANPNDFLVAGGGTGQVYHMARKGGAPMFLASNTSPANAVNGLAVAGGGLAIPFGQGCNGAAGRDGRADPFAN
jgi:hypothetical protein